MPQQPPEGTSALATRLERLRLPARLAYVALLLIATLTELDLDIDAEIFDRLQRMLLPDLSGRAVVDGVRNLTLFAGWGLLWMITSSPGRSWASMCNAVLTGGALSLFVECVQLLSDTRVASVLDIGTNTSGSLLGALTVVVAVRALASDARARSTAGPPLSVFALSYACAAAGEALIPLFRQSAPFSYAGGPIRRLFASIGGIRLSSLGELPMMDVLLFLPAGALAVAALSEREWALPKALRTVCAWAAVLLLAAEVAHGALGIEVRLGAWLAHTASVAVGALLAVKALPRLTRAFRPQERHALAAAMYTVVLAVWALRPFQLDTGSRIARKLASDWWIPLQSIRMRADLFTVVNVLNGFMLYFPLGAFLAVWPLRSKGPLSGILPGVYLAALLEALQVFVLRRGPDMTELMVQAAAIAAGWIIVRRAGFHPPGVVRSAPREPLQRTPPPPRKSL